MSIPEKLFANSTIAKSLITEEEERVANLRADAVEAIDRIEAEANAAIPAAIEAERKAKAKCDQLQSELRDAQLAYNKAASDKRRISIRRDSLCQPHVRFLKDNADPAIAELLAELSAGFSTTEGKLEAIHWLRDQAWKTPDAELQARLETIREQFPSTQRRSLAEAVA